MILSRFLIFCQSEPRDSYKKNSYKKKGVYPTWGRGWGLIENRKTALFKTKIWPFLNLDTYFLDPRSLAEQGPIGSVPLVSN